MSYGNLDGGHVVDADRLGLPSTRPPLPLGFVVALFRQVNHGSAAAI